MNAIVKLGRARALYRYFKDPAASLIGKVFVVLALIYLLDPVDAIPDVVPIFGWLDDIGVMSIAVAWMWKMIDRYRTIDANTPPAKLPE
jgi:uncharacterized membrane protein YkvA (DUF1232 family)